MPGGAGRHPGRRDEGPQQAGDDITGLIVYNECALGLATNAAVAG
jgi:hypothetical protein